MMLNVRCDNVFLLGESLVLSVEQGQRTAPVQPGRDLSLEHGHDAKDSVDMVPGLCRVAGRQSAQPPPPQRPSRTPGPHGRHRLLHRRPLLPPPNLNSFISSDSNILRSKTHCGREGMKPLVTRPKQCPWSYLDGSKQMGVDVANTHPKKFALSDKT
jgi:hypothetical protein